MAMGHPTCAMILVSTLLLISISGGGGGGGGGGGFTLAALSSSPALPVFIFGDSLSDVGNNNYLPFTVLKSNFLPYGVDYGSSSSNRIPTGRFSNGRLVLDIIGERLGFPAVVPCLSPKAIARDSKTLVQGLNYASAGCGILDGTAMNSSGCLSLSTQVKYHGKTITSLVAQLGIDQTQSLLSSSVYFMAIGSNDFIGNYFKKNSPDAKAYSPSQFVTLLSNSLTAQIMKLYRQSARKFVMVGLGPLGCIPSQRVKGACNVDLNNLAFDFNDAVNEIVNTMGSQFPDMKMTFANPYTIIQDFIENPSQYGFVDTSTACCGRGSTNSPCLPLFPYCSHRDTNIFWDIWHPSQAVNIRLADAFLTTNGTNVAPYTIMELFSS